MRKGFEERLSGKSFQLMLWQEKPEKPKMTLQTSEKNLGGVVNDVGDDDVGVGVDVGAADVVDDDVDVGVGVVDDVGAGARVGEELLFKWFKLDFLKSMVNQIFPSVLL